MGDWLEDDDAADADALGREYATLARNFKTLGFREGIDAGQEEFMQAGFDEGFRERIAAGEASGRLLGAVSALADVFATGSPHPGTPEAAILELRARLRSRPVDAAASGSADGGGQQQSAAEDDCCGGGGGGGCCKQAPGPATDCAPRAPAGAAAGWAELAAIAERLGVERSAVEQLGSRTPSVPSPGAG